MSDTLADCQLRIADCSYLSAAGRWAGWVAVSHHGRGGDTGSARRLKRVLTLQTCLRTTIVMIVPQTNHH